MRVVGLRGSEHLTGLSPAVGDHHLEVEALILGDAAFDGDHAGGVDDPGRPERRTDRFGLAPSRTYESRAGEPGCRAAEGRCPDDELPPTYPSHRLVSSHLRLKY